MEGLSQAKERLSRLRHAASVIVSSSAPLAERASAWLDFLQYHGTIYSKLEQASKVSPAAKRWFDAKKVERKADDLLRYLQHARNVGEHSIVSASGPADFSVSGTVQAGSGSLGISFGRNGKPFAVASGFSDVKFHQNEVMLHAAIDRGVAYRPPREHLGQVIESNAAKDVVKHALDYAETMIKEAEALDPTA